MTAVCKQPLKSQLILLAVLALLLSGCGTYRSKPWLPGTPPSQKEVSEYRDQIFQAQVDSAVSELGYAKLTEEKRLAFAVLDISEPGKERLAGRNMQSMMYAASLPKIAILFAGLQKAADGRVHWTSELRQQAELMIQYSDNRTASELFRRVGPEYIGEVLKAPEFRFYDRQSGGGLWVGKEYSKAPAWRREPLQHLSHAASPLQVVRLLFALEENRLLPEREALEMQRIMSVSKLPHKFIRGMIRTGGAERYLRKSGKWGSYHSDSILVDNGEEKFILVGLVNDSRGEVILEQLFVRVRGILRGRDGGLRFAQNRKKHSDTHS